MWTLWGKLAENAAEYLGKGSRVNIVGRLQNNNYEKDGEIVYGLTFTCEEIDYLDSKADVDARRERRGQRRPRKSRRPRRTGQRPQPHASRQASLAKARHAGRRHPLLSVQGGARTRPAFFCTTDIEEPS